MIFISKLYQVLVVNKDKLAMLFKELRAVDKDLIMFTITDVKLVRGGHQVHMVIRLKRKIQMEMLTIGLAMRLRIHAVHADDPHMRICASRCACKNLDADQPHIEQKRVLQRQILQIHVV